MSYAVSCRRDIAFEGYTDALSIKLMNKVLARRNLTIECSRRDIIQWDMYCRPLYDGDCTENGFKVVRALGKLDAISLLKRCELRLLHRVSESCAYAA